jgi:Raf kinase inhibitor-like YbhB/YbcL family protein|tara:strand:- start:4218 stop:4658 length:441 start_codon:yes stop_codon:yes gene_type:complete
MPEFSITCRDFNDGEEIPKKFGYKHGNEEPVIRFNFIPDGTKSMAVIMDDPDAMAAVGKVWVHWLVWCFNNALSWETDVGLYGKNDFGEIGWGGPAPPDKRHTYVFKAYALDIELGFDDGYSKQELEDAMKGHILAEAKLTGTFAP